MILKPYSVGKIAQESRSHLQIPKSQCQGFRTFSDKQVYHPMTPPERIWGCTPTEQNKQGIQEGGRGAQNKRDLSQECTEKKDRCVADLKPQPLEVANGQFIIPSTFHSSFPPWNTFVTWLLGHRSLQIFLLPQKLFVLSPLLDPPLLDLQMSEAPRVQTTDLLSPVYAHLHDPVIALNTTWCADHSQADRHFNLYSLTTKLTPCPGHQIISHSHSQKHPRFPTSTPALWSSWSHTGSQVLSSFPLSLQFTPLQSTLSSTARYILNQTILHHFYHHPPSQATITFSFRLLHQPLKWSSYSSIPHIEQPDWALQI